MLKTKDEERFRVVESILEMDSMEGNERGDSDVGVHEEITSTSISAIPRQVPRTVVDLQVSCRWVLPVDARDSCLEWTSVVVDQGTIVAVLPTAQALQIYDPREEVSRPESVLLPGFINAHTHTAMSLLRGLCDDEPLHQWLNNTVWPIEGEFAHQDGFCYDGSLLSIAEMIRGGTTCFSDMYWYPGETARAARDSGIRAALGIGLIDFPSRYASTADDYIARGREVAEEFKLLSTLSFTYAPHSPYTVSDSSWSTLGELARGEGRRMHAHVHETQTECDASLALDKANPLCHRSDHASTPLKNLERMGILGDNFVAVHMTALTDEEIEICARHKLHVIHCPTSAMKLASGVCRVSDLLDAGVNVALGTDGPASNNSLDMIEEMKTSAILGKLASRDPTRLSARTCLRMATINGAKALDIDQVTGSLESGKAADLVIIEIGTRAGTSPVFHPESTIVYSSSSGDVSDVWVHGRRLLAHGKLVTIDEPKLLERVRGWAKKLESFSKERVASNGNTVNVTA